jgi:hypothetical protein
MTPKLFLCTALASTLWLSGCASVPFASEHESLQAKSFPVPDENKAGLYIYRDSFLGKELKKDVYLDGKCLGETADKTFFYTQVAGGQSHTISTESEFSPNDISVFTEAGKNYFVRQYIKIGMFISGADVSQSTEQEGKLAISQGEVKLAKSGHCDN